MYFFNVNLWLKFCCHGRHTYICTSDLINLLCYQILPNKLYYMSNMLTKHIYYWQKKPTRHAIINKFT